MRKFIPVFTILLLLFSCSSIVVDEPVKEVEITHEASEEVEIFEPIIIDNSPIEDSSKPVLNEISKESVGTVEDVEKPIILDAESTPVIETSQSEDIEIQEEIILADILDSNSDVVEVEPVDDVKEEEPVVIDNTQTEEASEPISNEVIQEAEESEVIVPVVEDDSVSLAEVAAPAVSTVSTNFPKPVLDNEVSPVILQLLSVVVVITVVFTITIAIRGANRMKLQKGISIALSLLFTALPIVVSTLVAGWSYLWLLYLLLLLTYFVLRARWRDSLFV